MASSHALWKNRRVQLFEYFSLLEKEDIIELHDKEGVDFARIIKIAPRLPRGWYELAMLTAEDRKELFSDFWKSCYSFHPLIPTFIDQLFSNLEDVGVYLVKGSKEKYYEPYMIYHGINQEWFIGSVGASEEEIRSAKREFEGVIDSHFLSFCLIHNGFSKPFFGRVLNLQEIDREREKINQRKNYISNKNMNMEDLIPFFKKTKEEVYACLICSEEEIEVMTMEIKEDQIKSLGDCISWIEWFFVFCGSASCTTLK